MSLSEEKSSPSSTLSSNCESPLSTKVSKNKQELSPIPIPNTPPPPMIFAEILLHILFENKKSKDYCKKISLNQDGHFTFKLRPSIPLFVYLQRILKYVKIELSTLIIAMIYIDRICREKVFLNEFNIHRIMIIAIYIAYIYNEDKKYDNNYLSLVSGMSKDEIITLEEDFLELIEFKLFVNDEIYFIFQDYILKGYLNSKC